MLLRYKLDDSEVVLSMDEPDIGELINLLEKQHLSDYSGKAACFLRPETPTESRALMRYFATSWAETGEINPLLLEWAAACFHAISVNKKPDKLYAAKVLLMVNPFAHRPNRNRSRNWKITNRVMDLRCKGKTLEKSCAMVAEDFDLDESNVKKIYLRTTRTYAGEVPF